MDYTHLTHAELIEWLATYTAKYTSLLKGNSSGKEQDECKRMVDDLINEICRRNQTASKRSLTDNLLDRLNN